MAEGREPDTRMTLRVYTLSPEGQVTSDSGVLCVTPTTQIDFRSAYPPCACSRCRAEAAAVRAAR
jgi:hypothetical protein